MERKGIVEKRRERNPRKWMKGDGQRGVAAKAGLVLVVVVVVIVVVVTS